MASGGDAVFQESMLLDGSFAMVRCFVQKDNGGGLQYLVKDQGKTATLDMSQFDEAAIAKQLNLEQRSKNFYKTAGKRIKLNKTGPELALAFDWSGITKPDVEAMKKEAEEEAAAAAKKKAEEEAAAAKKKAEEEAAAAATAAAAKKKADEEAAAKKKAEEDADAAAAAAAKRAEEDAIAKRKAEEEAAAAAAAVTAESESQPEPGPFNNLISQTQL